MENAKDYEILSTNLQPSFWRKVKNIIRQNKKAALQEFLFVTRDGRGSIYGGLNLFSKTSLEETIQNIQNQVNSLQKKVIDLENQILVKEGKLNMLPEAL